MVVYTDGWMNEWLTDWMIKGAWYTFNKCTILNFDTNMQTEKTVIYNQNINIIKK